MRTDDGDRDAIAAVWNAVDAAQATSKEDR
jgi:hypothetical protein